MGRGRPAGYKKIDGVWMSKEAQDAMNNITPTATSTPTVNVSEIGAQSVTDALPQQRRTGTKVHTGKEIRDTEIKTGLVMIGNFSDNVGILVPVFVNPNRNEDWRNEHLTRIRKGV